MQPQQQKVAALYRHPVKGLRSEVIHKGIFQPIRGLIGDRAFAFQFLDESVPEELRNVPAGEAPWMSKAHLAVQHDWPDLARLVPEFDADDKTLTLSLDGKSISGRVDIERERDKLALFIEIFLKKSRPYEKARHPAVAKLRLIGRADLSSRYTDSNSGSVSLACEATFEDLGEKLGTAASDARRFRPNLVLSGAEAWSELKWAGKKIKIGGCILEFVKPLGRCANIDVNPETGVRDAEIYAKLKPTLGHAMTGVRFEVLQEGEIAVGDRWELL